MTSPWCSKLSLIIDIVFVYCQSRGGWETNLWCLRFIQTSKVKTFDIVVNWTQDWDLLILDAGCVALPDKLISRESSAWSQHWMAEQRCWPVQLLVRTLSGMSKCTWAMECHHIIKFQVSPSGTSSFWKMIQTFKRRRKSAFDPNAIWT